MINISVLSAFSYWKYCDLYIFQGSLADWQHFAKCFEGHSVELCLCTKRIRYYDYEQCGQEKVCLQKKGLDPAPNLGAPHREHLL